MTQDVTQDSSQDTSPPLVTRLSLAAKLSAVSRACAYVQKDKANSFHNYKYASAAAVLGHVNEALAEHRVGVTVHPTIESVVELKTARGTVERLVTVRMTLTLHDGDSGETLETSAFGSGQDTGDKAVMKAQTAGLKYAWMCALNIATGDDPEADTSVDERNAQPAQPAARAQGKPTPTAKAQTPAPAPSRGEEDQREPGSDDDAVAPPALAAFRLDAENIELPGEAVMVWIKHRAELAKLSPADRETAWKALCAKTEDVGKMKNAKVWLKRAISDEDARKLSTENNQFA